MPEVIRVIIEGDPVINMFLILGLGLLMGKIRVGGIELGSVTGVLLVGLVAGHLGWEIPTASHSIGFILFIYAVGVQAGPQFFGAFRRDGAKYLILAVTTAVSAMALAVFFSKLLGLDTGYPAGMLAGALTSSPTLVAARDAMSQGVSLPDGMTKSGVLDNISAAYAITYVFGLAGLILFVGFLPKVLRIDLAKEAQALESEDWVTKGGRDPDEYLRMAEKPTIRAYRVEKDDVLGKTFDSMDYTLPGDVQRIKRNNEVFSPVESTELEIGDIVAIVGTEQIHRTAAERIGPEVIDHEVLDRSVETMSIMVSNKLYDGKTLKELNIRGNYNCWLTMLTRSGMPMPRRQDFVLHRGDVLVVTGTRSALDELANRLGYAQSNLNQTDLVTFAFGIALGVLLGIPGFTIGGTRVALGTAGGVLLAGLIFGMLRTKNPTIGRLPGSARSLLMELGLLFFMTDVAVSAGGTIVETFMELGFKLAACGTVITLVPVMLTFVIGRYVLKMNSAIVFGAVTGSMTSTAALTQITSQAKSTLPTIGYVGTYAFANVLLALAGSLIMRL
jgi:putative transport protein